MWSLVIEESDGKRFLRIYRVIDGQAVHRGKSVPYDELKARCCQVVEKDSPLPLLSRRYILCLKRSGDTRQRRLEIKKMSFDGIMSATCLDLESGEILTLGDVFDSEGYTLDDVVGVLTREENNVIRSFQRRNAK